MIHAALEVHVTAEDAFVTAGFARSCWVLSMANSPKAGHCVLVEGAAQGSAPSAFPGYAYAHELLPHF